MTDRLEIFSRNIPPDMDAVLITSDVNRRYFLGFASNAGTFFITKDKNYFIIDGRYIEEARDAIKNCEVILQDKLYEQLSVLLKKHGIKTVGIEAHDVTLSKYMRLKSALDGVEILQDERVTKLIINQRGIKSQDEIDKIAAAQNISDKTFLHILNFIKPGRTEREIAIEMEHYSRLEGSEKPSFPFIVAAGKNSSLPHATPSDYTVSPGDFITLDFGSTVDGYCSDMTRTVAVGFVSDKQSEVYETVLKAQLAGLDVIRPGASCLEVDKAARNVIDATRYKGMFIHAFGHSLGLEVHEPPRCSAESADMLEAGAVVSAEPGIYLPKEFGVRIEDIVVVNGNGYRNLVKADKKLTIL